MHGLLERSNIDGNKVIVEVISLQSHKYGVKPKAALADSSDDEDMNAVVYNMQTAQPQKPKTEEEKAKEASEAKKTPMVFGASPDKKEEKKEEEKKETAIFQEESDSDDYDKYESKETDF